MAAITYREQENNTYYSVHGLQPHTKERDMKAKEEKISDELRPEYDFDYSRAVRGKCYNASWQKVLTSSCLN